MNHIDAMFQSDADDVVLGEISPDWGQTLANSISLVSLYSAYMNKFEC
jgi:hypothetical protein